MLREYTAGTSNPDFGSQVVLPGRCDTEPETLVDELQKARWHGVDEVGIVIRKKMLPGEGEQHVQMPRGGSECGEAGI